MADENVKPKTVSLGEVLIEGKISKIDQPQNSDYTYYTFSLKSKDEYSLPATVQVSQPATGRPFAREGDLIRIKCIVGGFPRKAGGNTYITNTLNFVEVF